MESEDDEVELEDTITVQPRINREPKAMISNDSDPEDYSPAFIMGAFFEGAFNQNILLDCGAMCSIISGKLLSHVKTKLCDPRRELSVSGMGGKIRITIDLRGHGG